MDSIIKTFKALEDYGIHVALILAGWFGAIVAISHKRELTKTQKALAMLSGAIIGNYLTPVLFEYININENTKYGIACMFGFSGYEGIKWFIDLSKRKLNKKN